MSNQVKLSVSPHIHSGNSTRGIMLDVLIALLPTTVAGAIIFGARALLVVAACVVSCVGFEALFNLIVKKKQTIGDLSAAVTGLLLALNLPSTVPIWQCVVGSLFAIVVVKCLFGGIGCNIVNPAITARVFMLIAFGSMAKAGVPTIVDAVSSATPLSAEAGAKLPSILDLLLGLRGGAIGEVCVIALVVGLVYLLARRVITWHIPVTFIGTVFVASFFMDAFGRSVPRCDLYGNRLRHLSLHKLGQGDLRRWRRSDHVPDPLFRHLSRGRVLRDSADEYRNPLYRLLDQA